MLSQKKEITQNRLAKHKILSLRTICGYEYGTTCLETNETKPN